MLLTLALFGQMATRCVPRAANGEMIVAKGTLAAVAGTESGFDTLAIKDDTTNASHDPANRVAAIALARRLLAEHHDIDAGLMQVNSTNWRRYGLNLDSVFDGCRNIAAGAMILDGGYHGGASDAAKQKAIMVAFSRYQSGNAHTGFADGYVAHVLATARHVVPEIEVQPERSPAVKPHPSPGHQAVFADPASMEWAGNSFLQPQKDDQ